MSNSNDAIVIARNTLLVLLALVLLGAGASHLFARPARDVIVEEDITARRAR